MDEQTDSRIKWSLCIAFSSKRQHKNCIIQQWTVPQLSIMIIYNSIWSILIQWITGILSGDNLNQKTQKKDPFTSLHKIKENLPQWVELEILWNGACTLMPEAACTLLGQQVCKLLMELVQGLLEWNLPEQHMDICYITALYWETKWSANKNILKKLLFYTILIPLSFGTNATWKHYKKMSASLFSFHQKAWSKKKPTLKYIYIKILSGKLTLNIDSFNS